MQLYLSKYGQHVSSVKVTGAYEPPPPWTWWGTPHVPWSSEQWCNFVQPAPPARQGGYSRRVERTAGKSYSHNLPSIRKIPSPARPSALSLSRAYVQLGSYSGLPGVLSADIAAQLTRLSCTLASLRTALQALQKCCLRSEACSTSACIK